MDNINEEFNDNNVKIPNKKISNRIRELKEKGTEGIVKFFNMQCNSIIGDLFNGVKKFTYKNSFNWLSFKYLDKFINWFRRIDTTIF